MESYIVQLNFSAAFDRVSHSGPIFKLKSVGVDGSVLSICTEFLSDHRQRVVVDGATGEWIPHLYRLSSVGIGGSVLSVLIQLLSNRSQYVLVHGCRSKLVNVVSGVPQGGVLGPLLFLLYTSELFSILENELIGYADDSTLMAVVPSPGARVMVAESLNRDLVRVNA